MVARQRMIACVVPSLAHSEVESGCPGEGGERVRVRVRVRVKTAREGVDSGKNKGETAQRALLHVVPSPQCTCCWVGECEQRRAARLMASTVGYEPEPQQDCNPSFLMPPSPASQI